MYDFTGCSYHLFLDHNILTGEWVPKRKRGSFLRKRDEPNANTVTPTRIVAWNKVANNVEPARFCTTIRTQHSSHFGCDDLIEKVISLAESLTPITLIGPGGIGKTSVALSVLHHDRIRKQFGHNRRFICCDEFPPSRTHPLARLSKVTGVGVENPEDLTPLRTSLSPKETMIIIDNGESILDPQRTDGQLIYRVVEGLSQFSTICIVITSHITTIPPTCETVDVPTVSTGAAHDTFYNIYKYGDRSGVVNEILRRLDFHPLSVTLLATAASS